MWGVLAKLALGRGPLTSITQQQVSRADHCPALSFNFLILKGGLQGPSLLDVSRPWS